MTNLLTQAAARQLAERYLTALAAADVAGILSLFAPDAEVHSPLYGLLPAAHFYPRLMRDTTRSEVALHDVLIHAEKQSLAIYFHYRWQLADGQWSAFDCMDWLQLDAEGRILSLHIVYDTAATRPAFSAQRNTRP